MSFLPTWDVLVSEWERRKDLGTTEEKVFMAVYSSQILHICGHSGRFVSHSTTEPNASAAARNKLLLMMLEYKFTNLSCRVLLGLAVACTPLQHLVNSVQTEKSMAGPRPQDSAFYKQATANIKNELKGIDYPSRSVEEFGSLEKAYSRFKASSNSSWLIVEHVLEYFQTHIQQSLVTWLPSWSLHQSDSIRRHMGATANSSVDFFLGLMMCERGWRSTNLIGSIRELSKEVQTAEMSMRFLQFTDANLLTCILMQELCRTAQVAAKVESVSDTMAESIHMLKGLGLVVGGDHDEIYAVPGAMSPGADVLWWAARAKNPDCVIRASESISSELYNYEAGNAETYERLAQELKNCLDDIPIGRNSQQPEDEKSLLNRAVTLTAGIASSIQGDSAENVGERLMNDWRTLQQVQALMRNCFLLMIFNHPEQFYCIGTKARGSLTPLCVRSPLCTQYDCDARAQSIRGRLLSLYRHTYIEHIVQEKEWEELPALVAHAEEQLADSAVGCKCGAENIWNTQTAKGGIKNADTLEVGCSKACTPPKAEAKAGHTLVAIEKWPHLVERGDEKTWKDAADQIQKLFRKDAVPGIKSVVDNACSRFDALSERLDVASKVPHNRQCVFTISNNNLPWKCKPISQYTTESVKRASRRKNVQGTPPTAADKKTLECFYLRKLVRASLFGDKASSRISPDLGEMSEDMKRIISGIASVERCEVMLNKDSAALTQTDDRIIKEARKFASVVINKAPVAELKKYQNLITCKLAPPANHSGHRCQASIIRDASQYGAADSGCTPSLLTSFPYVQCGATQAPPATKTQIGKKSVRWKLRNLNCSPTASTGTCDPSTFPSAECISERVRVHNTENDRVLCHSKPDWIMNAKSLESCLREQFRRNSENPVPWEENAWGIEIGHPAVVFPQPRNCTPLYRSAPPGDTFILGLPSEDLGKDENMSALKAAIAAVLMSAALCPHETSEVSAHSSLFASFRRIGICTGSGGADPSATCALPVPSGTSGRQWIPWAETGLAETAIRTLDKTSTDDLKYLFRFMDETGLNFSGSNILFDAEGSVRKSIRKIRPTSITLTPNNEVSNVRRYAGKFVNFDESRGSGLNPSPGMLQSVERAKLYLEAFVGIQDRFKTESTLLAHVSPYAQLGPLCEAISETPPSDFYWTSGHRAYMESSNRPILSKDGATRILHQHRAPYTLDSVIYVQRDE